MSKKPRRSTHPQKPRRPMNVSIELGEKLEELKREMGASTLNAVLRNLIYLYDQRKAEGIELPRWGRIFPPKPPKPKGEPEFGWYDEQIEARHLPIRVKRQKGSKTKFVCIVCGNEWEANVQSLFFTCSHSPQNGHSSSDMSLSEKSSSQDKQ